MNANELADYLDNNVGASVDEDNRYIDLAVTMLRQQQETIEHQNEEYLALSRFQKSLQEQNKQQQKENAYFKNKNKFLLSVIKDKDAEMAILRKAQEK